ncbi:MAG: hypothetical protein LUH07_04410 [Lachnospiraceae bacterium]|nr:hypothetical protein [Lachnospiraceae bacterium]
MRQKRPILLFGAFLLLAGMNASAAETVLTEVETEAETVFETEAETETEYETEADSWMDYQITIDGDEYSFPMMCEDFVALGWVSDETEDTLEPYTYDIYYFTKEDLTCPVYILNLGINTLSVENCIVAGISIDRYYWDDSDIEVELPAGIIKGVSTADDIIAAYGTPTDTYEGTMYTQYTYEEDYNQEVELTIYLESGVLEEIQIENFIEPEDFEPGEIDTDVPQSVLAYVKPDSLSDSLLDYEIEIAGEVYTLPVPVSVMTEDGWELDKENSDTQITAQYYGWVTLCKDNQTFSAIVTNSEDYATIPENCWLEELSVGGYTLDMDGALPGGVGIGITEEEFLSILEENGMEYEYSESSDYHYYTYNAPSYGSSCNVTVYTGTNSFFEKDTIIEISCENALE